MTEEERVREKQVRERTFPQHVARFYELTCPGRRSIQCCQWRKPGTGIEAITYLIDTNRLFVTGDMFSAVYVWGSEISWEFLSGLGLDYFASKAEASPTGRGFESWDKDEAVKNVLWHLRDRAESKYGKQAAWPKLLACIDADVADTKVWPRWSAYVSCFDDVWQEVEEACESRDAWVALMQEHGDELLGSDWWERSDGMCVDRLCRVHLVGLRMAYSQLEARTEKGVPA